MSPEKNIVSVIIPAYQHETFICECIESILAQTYSDIELIVIDDASTDGTLRAAENMRERCEARFVRTVIMSKKKGCTAASCNMGIEMAQGEYIYLIASDDAALPHAVETLAAILDADAHCVLAVGDNAFFDESSTPIGWDAAKHAVPVNDAVFRTFGDALGLNRAGRKHDNFGTYAELLRGNHVPNGYLMRRSALLQTGGYNEKVFIEDWYMNLQLSKIGTMRYIPEVLFRYRWHTGNTIKKYDSKEKHKIINRQICNMEREYAMKHGHAKVLRRLDPDSMRNRCNDIRRRFLDIVNIVFYFNRKKRTARLCGIAFHW